MDRPCERLLIRDDLVLGSAWDFKVPEADYRLQPGEEEVTIRLVVAAVAVADEKAERRHRIRVRFTNVVDELRDGTPVAESFYFDVTRGDLQTLREAIARAEQIAERYLTGQLVAIGARQHPPVADAIPVSNVVDLRIV